jgi:hypothetical protein
MHQEQITALARMSLLLEVRAVAEDKSSWLGADFAWLTLENVANSSPSSSALTNWVIALAQDQYMIFLQKMLGATLPIRWRAKGARGWTLHKTETPDGTSCQFWADITFAGRIFL